MLCMWVRDGLSNGRSFSIAGGVRAGALFLLREVSEYLGWCLSAPAVASRKGLTVLLWLSLLTTSASGGFGSLASVEYDTLVERVLLFSTILRSP